MSTSASSLGIATDMANPNFAGAMNPDSVLFVKFFDMECPNEFKSIQEGRPVKEMRTMVHIETPGNQLSIIETFAHEGHQKRFPQQWAHYMNTKNNSESIQGTMLSDWPLLNSAQVTELKYFKFYTVEQVAGASDEQIGHTGMISGMSPYAFREKAKLYLKAAADNALVNKQDEQIKAQAAENARLAEEMRQMKAQMAALSAAKQAEPEAKRDTISVKK